MPENVKELWALTNLEQSKLGSFRQNPGRRVSILSLSQRRRAALRVTVKGGQATQALYNLLSFFFRQTLVHFLMEPQSLGFDL